ncbi:MAG: hypothetical protein WCF96_02230 [Eubacteriales bacterium]
MGSIVNKLGPITGYWILIIAALGLAKLFNWVDIENTMATIKFIGIITLGYVGVYGLTALIRTPKRK